MSRFQATVKKSNAVNISYKDQTSSPSTTTTSSYGSHLKAIASSIQAAKLPTVNDEETMKKRKEKQKQVSNLANNKSDSRFGVLNGYVISIRDPNTFKNKGTSQSSNVSNVGTMVKSGSAPGVAGNGKLKPTLVMWVAICEIEKVAVEKFADNESGATINSDPTTTDQEQGIEVGCGRLFERTNSGCIKLKYAMEGKPDPSNSKKKLWTCVPLDERRELFKLRKGDVVMVSIWEGAAGISEGNLIQLTNVKLTREIKVTHASPNTNNGGGGSLVLRSNTHAISNYITPTDISADFISQNPTSVSVRYYFNCSVNSSPTDWNDLPKTTQLKHLFTFQGRQPHSLAKLYKIYKTQQNQTSNLTPPSSPYNSPSAATKAFLKKIQQSSSSDNERDDDNKTHKKQLQWLSGVTPSILITINTPSILDGKMVPTRDEYDKSYDRILKESGGGGGVEESDQIPKIYSDEEIERAEQDYALYSRCGAVYETEYPTLTSEVKVTPQSGDKAPWIKWNLNITSVSWGHPGGFLDKEYRSPVIAPNSETDMPSGLICVSDPNLAEGATPSAETKTKATSEPTITNNTSGKEIWHYNFHRSVIVTALYENQLKTLGPSGLDDIVAIMTSYQIPFTMLLGINVKETCDTPTNSSLLKEGVGKQSEENRWTKVPNDKAVQEYLRQSKGAKWFYKDGAITGTPQLAVFHVAQFLEDNATMIPPVLMTEIWETMVGAANSNKNRISMDDKNSFAYPNAEGYVYLNAMKVHPEDLLKQYPEKEYKFYALICYGDTLLSLDETNQANIRDELITITKRSRDFVLREIGDPEATVSKIRKYISKSTARKFYYAVDVKVSKNCKELAKKLFKEQIKLTSDKLGLNNAAATTKTNVNAFVEAMETQNEEISFSEIPDEGKGQKTKLKDDCGEYEYDNVEEEDEGEIVLSKIREVRENSQHFSEKKSAQSDVDTEEDEDARLVSVALSKTTTATKNTKKRTHGGAALKTPRKNKTGGFKKQRKDEA